MRYQEFIDFAADQLDLDQVPEINIDDSGLDQTFGHYSDHGITVSSKARHPADVMRTIAHELVHYKQDQLGQLDQDSGATGSDEENQANAQAGVIMRNYSRENPDIYESQLDELVGAKKHFGNIPQTGLKGEKSNSSWEQYLLNHGFRKLGKGLFGSVWDHPSLSYVIKIFTTKDTAYVEWVKYCLANQQNSMVPKFRGSLIHLARGVYAIRMEKLIFGTKDAQLFNQFLRTVLMVNPSARHLVQAWVQRYLQRGLDPKISVRIKRQEQDFLDVYMWMRRRCNSLDLHSGNLAIRPNQTRDLVITDPLAYMGAIRAMAAGS